MKEIMINWLIANFAVIATAIGGFGTASAGLWKTYKVVKGWAQQAKESALQAENALKELDTLHVNLREDYRIVRERLTNVEAKEQACEDRVKKLTGELEATKVDGEARYKELYASYEATATKLEQAYKDLARKNRTKGRPRPVAEASPEWEIKEDA